MACWFVGLAVLLFGGLVCYGSAIHARRIRPICIRHHLEMQEQGCPMCEQQAA